jgi:hypothetical protein
MGKSKQVIWAANKSRKDSSVKTLKKWRKKHSSGIKWKKDEISR